MAGILRSISPKSYEKVDKELGGCKTSGVPKAEFRRGGKGVVWEDGHGVGLHLRCSISFCWSFLSLNEFLPGLIFARDHVVYPWQWLACAKECLETGISRCICRGWQRPWCSPCEGQANREPRIVPLADKKMLLFRNDVAPPDSLCAQTKHETPFVKKKMEVHTGDSSELPPPDPYRANAP